MINSQEIKKGTCIRMDGGIWKCIWFEHRKPGKGNTVMNTKLKNVADGRVLDRTFQVGFKLDDVRVEHRPYQYLYEDSTGCIFMNQETFEALSYSEAKENMTLSHTRSASPMRWLTLNSVATPWWKTV